MAGDWIKMRTDLLTSPKIVRIASALKADRLRVVGGLFAVWCLFDTHSADGLLDGYTLDAVDELVGFPGFAAAMAAVDWLIEKPDGLAVPRFDEHNGQSAKRRCQESERKRKARKESASDADKVRTREEKRREEKREVKPLAPQASPSPRGTRLTPDWELPTEWAEWAVQEFPLVPVVLEASKFRDYWVAKTGKDATKADWSATWRNWVRKAAERAPRQMGGASGSSTLDHNRAVAEEALRRAEERERHAAQ